MSRINLLNVLEATENFHCVHRNYSSLSKVSKRIVLLCVCFVIVLYVFTTFELMLCQCRFFKTSFTCFIIVAKSFIITVATSIIIVNGIRYSEAYKNFGIKMDQMHDYCKDNISYRKSMKGLLVLFLFLAASWALLNLFLYYDKITNALGLIAYKSMFTYFWKLTESFIVMSQESCVTLEFHVFIFLVRMMVIFLNVMKVNLTTILKKLERSEDGLHSISYFELRKDLRKWAAAYDIIAVCCDDLKTLFGIQVTKILDFHLKPITSFIRTL